MKRRKFLQRLGLGFLGALIPFKAKSQMFNEGEVCLSLTPDSPLKLIEYLGQRALVYVEEGTYNRDVWHKNGTHTVVQGEVLKKHRIVCFFLDDDGMIVRTADCNSTGCGIKAAWEGVARAFWNPRVKNCDCNPLNGMFVKSYYPRAERG